MHARLKRITAVVLPAIALICALPVANASAELRHSRDTRHCELHEVIVKGEVASSAASGASSFTARVWSVQVRSFHPFDGSKTSGSRDGDRGACPIAGGTTTKDATTASGTSAPVMSGTSGSPVAINTDSTTKIMLNGAASSVSSLPHGDHFVAVFLVPAAAGDASNSGIPAALVAAWPSHESAAAITRATDGELHLFGDRFRHESAHHTLKK
jgi:hypothetical protein